MTIRIIKAAPAKPTFRGTCSTCRAEVEFDHDDGAASPDPRDSNDAVRYVECPIPRCGGQVFGSPVAAKRSAVSL